MIVVGIDPGTRATGFGVIEVNGSRINSREYGVIRAKPSLPLSERLSIIYEGVSSVLDSWNPSVVGVEQAFFGQNAKTALTLGHARGVILLASHSCGAKIIEPTPTEVKKVVTGNGHATKDQVEYMVRILLKLPADKIKDDAFDGLALALTAHNYNGFPRS